MVIIISALLNIRTQRESEIVTGSIPVRPTITDAVDWEYGETGKHKGFKIPRVLKTLESSSLSIPTINNKVSSYNGITADC